MKEKETKKMHTPRHKVSHSPIIVFLNPSSCALFFIIYSNHKDVGVGKYERVMGLWCPDVLILLLTLSAHTKRGLRSWFVCLSVCPSVTLSAKRT